MPVPWAARHTASRTAACGPRNQSPDCLRNLIPAAVIRTEVALMSGWFLGIGLGVLYLVLLFTVAIMTFRKGHWVLGLIGFIFPVLWLIGAILPATHGSHRG
jgi:hypothetical protein